MREDHVGLQRDQLFREHLRLRRSRRKAIVNADIAAFRPSTLLEPLPECREASPHFRIVLGVGTQHADPPYPVRLLRARRQRPRGRRAPEERDELASPHVEHGDFLPYAYSAPTGPFGRFTPLSLPHCTRQVLGANLNCSESRWATVDRPALPPQT